MDLLATQPVRPKSKRLPYLRCLGIRVALVVCMANVRRPDNPIKDLAKRVTRRQNSNKLIGLTATSKVQLLYFMRCNEAFVTNHDQQRKYS